MVAAAEGTASDMTRHDGITTELTTAANTAKSTMTQMTVNRLVSSVTLRSICVREEISVSVD